MGAAAGLPRAARPAGGASLRRGSSGGLRAQGGGECGADGAEGGELMEYDEAPLALALRP